MYNLEQHSAFEFFKVSKVISNIIDELLQEPSYCYTKFNTKINDAAEKVGEQIFKLIQPNHPSRNSIPYYSTKNFKNKEELTNKIKGDLFELFVMFFLQYFDRFPAVFGIKAGTYVQVSDDEDAGMDFYGIRCTSGKNERVFGQIKYRNPDIPMQEENKVIEI